jgi:putative transposase
MSEGGARISKRDDREYRESLLAKSLAQEKKGVECATLADANAHRPCQLYQAVFYQLLARCQAAAGRKKFRIKNRLLILDPRRSTSAPRCFRGPASVGPMAP